ncbi:Zn-ribbon domain-containing OB-fold protein [Hydrogenophaga intermedia]|uniref:Zn-ribbon domain-containing OB-fold protein n=1 Tax=Hydrogenophaga intermedia TaxID=65786 RepID=UPI002042C41C|nr:OB-fold domain-containing protein [Hydrogenophaga intermedia]MCM3562730.1 OB-fold domain-containing protein [Hydrogenophaga intermedia]
MNEDTPTGDWTRGPGPDAVFAQFIAAGEFRIQRCESCHGHVFYPRLACSHCGSVELRWVRPSGRGVVHAVSIVHRRSEQGGPYNVVLVDLQEGPRMMGRVDGQPHDSIRIGLRVKARVGSAATGEPCVVFDAAGDADAGAGP